MSLFEQIGGDQGMAKAVDDFYERMLADETLEPWFRGADLSQLKHHQRAFLAVGLGGPELYTGRSMRNAHAGLRITDAAYSSSVDHLAAALAGLGMSAGAVQKVIKRIELMRAAIVDVR